jgi:hypothetical protein
MRGNLMCPPSASRLIGNRVTDSTQARGCVAAWEPIETAPKDETHVLVCWAGAKPFRTFQNEDGEWSMHGCPTGVLSGQFAPTYWQPLPSPPPKPFPAPTTQTDQVTDETLSQRGEKA